jgi:UDP-N-acetylmuramoylalanine--D-glutamate ligase
MTYRGKSVAVLGLGASGEAAAKLLARHDARVTVFDDGDPSQFTAKLRTLRKLGVDLQIGPAAQPAISAGFDLVVISPGIDPTSKLVRCFAHTATEMIGELELAFQFCHKPVIAITGTNGKTTTTQLVEKMLRSAGLRTLACGNIGTPFSTALDHQDEIDFFSVEVSSFQLETIKGFSPAVVVWLNFSPDHLDRYQSVEDYRRAKLRIFENLHSKSVSIVRAGEDLPDLVGKKITFSAYHTPADLELRYTSICFQGKPILNLEETRLSGPHNAENLMAALGVAHALRIPWSRARTGLLEYNLPPHRCEMVRNLDGVLYINDSKATNPDALAKALETQTRPVILIAGGKNKGFDFRPLQPKVREKVRHVVLIGEMGPVIARAWEGCTAIAFAANLHEAVFLAQSAALPGSVVLFSPGTSSFDMFRDYADRGDQFRQIVRELSPWE